MRPGFNSLLVPALAERLTLVLNHVLGSEPAATERLRPHAGSTVQLLLEDWPTLLPRPPQLAWSITPAGMLEWCGPEPVSMPLSQGEPPDWPPAEPPSMPFSAAPGAGLVARLDASNPALLLARALAGEPPPLRIDGPVQLATDVNWLVQNLRWDVAADMERVFGPVAGHQLHRLGSAVGSALRSALSLAVRGATRAGERWRPRGT